MITWTPLILPSDTERDMSSGHVAGEHAHSIWADWFYAGNNVPMSIQPNGLVARTEAFARDVEARADAKYAHGAFDRMHLGQHDNGQPRTIRPQNTPWVDIRGRLLQEEA